MKRTESLTALDKRVVAIAEKKTTGQLRSWLNRTVARLEPDQAESRSERARRGRRVGIEPAGDHMSWLSALIPSVEAAAIDQLLDTRARAMTGEDAHEQKRADAFTAIFGSDASGASGAASIGVVVPIQSLLGLSDTPGEMSDRSDAVPASLIRAKAIEPDTLFWRLLTDEAGNLLDITKIGRFSPEDLTMAIRFRDGTSVFPTAAVPASRCDVDHSEAHPAPTTAANLGALHRRAHNLKTRGLLSMRQPEPGSFEWVTRTGHTYTRQPEPLPTADWEQTAWFDDAFLDAIGHSPAA